MHWCIRRRAIIYRFWHFLHREQKVKIPRRFYSFMNFSWFESPIFDVGPYHKSTISSFGWIFLKISLKENFTFLLQPWKGKLPLPESRCKVGQTRVQGPCLWFRRGAIKILIKDSSSWLILVKKCWISCEESLAPLNSSCLPANRTITLPKLLEIFSFLSDSHRYFLQQSTQDEVQTCYMLKALLAYLMGNSLFVHLTFQYHFLCNASCFSLVGSLPSN